MRIQIKSNRPIDELKQEILEYTTDLEDRDVVGTRISIDGDYSTWKLSYNVDTDQDEDGTFGYKDYIVLTDTFHNDDVKTEWDALRAGLEEIKNI